MINLSIYICTMFAIAGLRTDTHDTPDTFQVSPMHQAAPTSTDVSVGIYVNRLWGVDISQRSFHADLYLWVTGEGNGDELGDFEFLNMADDDLIIRDDTNDKARDINGSFYRVYRVMGRFLFDLNLSSYPFDIQEFPIVVESVSNHTAWLRYIYDDASKIDNFKSIGDWDISRARVSSSIHPYNTDFSDPLQNEVESFSQITFSVTAYRQALPYVLKTIIPLILIVFVSNLIFFIDPRNIDSRVAICVATFFAAIGLQITAGSGLPNVGYLTIMDKMFILGYAFIALSTLQMVWTSRMESEYRHYCIWVNRISGLVFPVIYSVMSYTILST